MDTEQEFELRVISLRDLWEVFRRRFMLMLLAAALVAGGAFAFTQLTFKPRYESTATLYIFRQADEQSQSSSTTYSDFTLALRLVNDCNYILKSHSTLDPVISNLGLDLEYNDLYDSITVSNPDDTRILAVKVEADTPEEAKRIVDEVCEIGIVQIEEAMGFEQVTLFESGIPDEKPCNTTPLTTFAILGLLAAVVVYAIYLIAFLLDDRIRTDEDIEHMLGLSVLGDIPNANSSRKGRGYKGYYGKRYYGKKYYGGKQKGSQYGPGPAAVPANSAQEGPVRGLASGQAGVLPKQQPQPGSVRSASGKADPRVANKGKGAGAVAQVPLAKGTVKARPPQMSSAAQQSRQDAAEQVGKRVR